MGSGVGGATSLAASSGGGRVPGLFVSLLPRLPPPKVRRFAGIGLSTELGLNDVVVFKQFVEPTVRHRQYPATLCKLPDAPLHLGRAVEAEAVWA